MKFSVVVIKRGTPDSLNGTPSFAAVATDEEAAKQWIQDEVDGKHGSGHTHAAGIPVEQWILNGYFILSTEVLHGMK